MFRIQYGTLPNTTRGRLRYSCAPNTTVQYLTLEYSTKVTNQSHYSTTQSSLNNPVPNNIHSIAHVHSRTVCNKYVCMRLFVLISLSSTAAVIQPWPSHDISQRSQALQCLRAPSLCSRIATHSLTPARLQRHGVQVS